MQCQQFDVSLTILHPDLSRHHTVVPVIEVNPLNGPFDGLLGRDILADCMLVYQGQVRTFYLAF